MEISNLLTILDRPIAFHPSLAFIAGSVNGGVFLSQALYWSKRTPDGSGWFYKIQDEWYEETCLSRFEQETVRKALKSKGFLEEKQEGIPKKLYYKINMGAISTALQGLADKSAGIPHSRVLETSTLECGNTAHTLYTESTTESTQSVQNLERETEEETEFEVTPIDEDGNPLIPKKKKASKSHHGAIFNLRAKWVSLVANELALAPAQVPVKNFEYVALAAMKRDNLSEADTVELFKYFLKSNLRPEDKISFDLCLSEKYIAKFKVQRSKKPLTDWDASSEIML